MNASHLTNEFDRYLSGKATPDESFKVEQWLGEEFKEVTLAPDLAPFVGDVDADLKAIAAKRQPVVAGISSHGRLKSWGRWAAGACALAAISLAAVYIPRKVSTTDSIVYTTDNGQRARITLADGSTAVLAPATTLRVNGRDITLDGEAMFTVHQNKSTPFTVNGGNIVTRVLGTTFAMRTYENQVRVAVGEGRVSVNSATLNAGDVVFIRGKKAQLQHDIDVATFFAFASGTLSFADQPLTDVIPDLERWYNVDVQVLDNRLLAQRVDGVFTGTSAGELSEALEFLLRVRVVREGRVIKVYGN